MTRKPVRTGKAIGTILKLPPDFLARTVRIDVKGETANRSG